MRDQYLAAGIGSREDYTQIFSGFPLEPYLATERAPSIRKKLGLLNDDFVVGKIARLFELKGHEDLFAVAPRVAQRVPNVRFLLVGDGVWRVSLERVGKRRGGEAKLRVHRPGSAQRHPVTRGRHGLPRASLPQGRSARALPQAMAAGKPVVAFDCDGAGEVCLDGETGALIHPGDLAKLEDSLVSLAKDEALRQSLGQSAQVFVKEKFTVERLVEDQYQLYQRLLSKR